MIPSVWISGVFILSALIFGIIYNLCKYSFSSKKVNDEGPTKHLSVPSRVSPVITNEPDNLYIKTMTELLPKGVVFDPADAKFVTCPNTTMMYLVACPGRGWDQKKIKEIDWRSTPPKQNFTRLYVLNNCFKDIYMGAVGTGVPVLLNGAKIAHQEIEHYDIPFGSTLAIFARSPCQMDLNIRGQSVLQCKDCTCPPTEDGIGCKEPGFACSQVDFSSTSKGAVKYRVNHTNGFTMTYLLSASDECKTAGGSLFYNRQEILKQCPEPLAFTDEQDPLRITACVNTCKICQIEEASKNCQCTKDDDCFLNCPNYSFHIIPNTSRPPLKCLNNRCVSKMDHRCSDTYRDKLTYRDVYCCQNLTPQECSLLNKSSNP
jgi:hypothetical protein